MNFTPHHTELEITGDSEVRPIKIWTPLSILAALLLLILGAGVAPQLIAMRETPPEQQTAAATIADPETSPESPGNAFQDVRISGDSAFVFDMSTQRALFATQPDEQLPLASITKLMTALLAHELATPETTITISEAAIEQDGASGLQAAESFKLSNLRDLLLLSSSNDGAFAVAESIGADLDPDAPAEAFVQAMNIRADELGMNQTYFRNPTGLDITETEAGAYGSARDIVILMQYIIRTYPELLEATRTTQRTLTNEAGYPHTVHNTNPYVETIPGLIGSKTGYTELAGGNLAVAFEAGINRPIIIVVLGSSRSGRFQDIQTLSAAAQAAVQ